MPFPLLNFPTERCYKGPEAANKETDTGRRGSGRREETKRFFPPARGASRRGTLPLREQTLLRREQSAPLDERNTGPSEQVDPGFRSGGFRGEGREAAVDSGHLIGYSAGGRKFFEESEIKKGNFAAFTLLSTEGDRRVFTGATVGTRHSTRGNMLRRQATQKRWRGRPALIQPTLVPMPQAIASAHRLDSAPSRLIPTSRSK